ncbi:hypothetical protein R1sor_024481 [Riccia sorocarpa]|uniref:Uncharacterized protein n=1 Tax=Riccia sorocarpa TaxID=122646 RepID=A0ABD3GQM0_9MARC
MISSPVPAQAADDPQGGGFEVVGSKCPSRRSSQQSGSQPDYVSTSNRFMTLVSEEKENEEEEQGENLFDSTALGEGEANPRTGAVPIMVETQGDPGSLKRDPLRELASEEAAKLEGANNLAFNPMEDDNRDTLVELKANPFPSIVTSLHTSEDHVSLGKEVEFAGELDYQKWGGRGPKKKGQMSHRLRVETAPIPAAEKRRALGTIDHNGCRHTERREGSLSSTSQGTRERKRRDDSLSRIRAVKDRLRKQSVAANKENG